MYRWDNCAGPNLVQIFQAGYVILSDWLPWALTVEQIIDVILELALDLGVHGQEVEEDTEDLLSVVCWVAGGEKYLRGGLVAVSEELHHSLEHHLLSHLGVLSRHLHQIVEDIVVLQVQPPPLSHHVLAECQQELCQDTSQIRNINI